VIDSASYPAAIPVALVGDAAHAMPPTLFQVCARHPAARTHKHLSVMAGDVCDARVQRWLLRTAGRLRGLLRPMVSSFAARRSARLCNSGRWRAQRRPRPRERRPTTWSGLPTRLEAPARLGAQVLLRARSGTRV
jgi:hypothetical protein